MSDKKSRGWAAIRIFLGLALIFGTAAYLIFMPTALAEEDKAALVSEGRFLSGISVNGVDIGGMTFSQAKTALKPVEEGLRQSCALTLMLNGQSCPIPPESMRLSFDTDKVLTGALMLAQEGDMIERSRMKASAQQGTHLKIHYSVDGITAAARAADAAKALERKPVNAEVTFSAKDRSFTYTPEQTGLVVDTDELTRLVKKACEEQDFSAIEIPTQTLIPELAEEYLRSVTARRSIFSTSFADAPYNDANRVHNIKKCVELVNSSEKTVMEPGEMLSLNDVLGDRTLNGGWKLAPGYIGGRSEDQPGGGVCQISTTLYCAAMAADLEITDRSNHSIPVGYSKRGLDATISTGGPDLVIKNCTGSRIYICAWTSSEQKLYFEIFGEPFKGFSSISLTSVKIRDIEPEGETVYTTDDTKPADYEEIFIKRRTGSFWRTYKVYKDGEGEIMRREADTSTYRAFAGETIVGVP